MRPILFIPGALFLLTIFFSPISAFGQKVNVTVTNIRSEKGNLVLHVFKDQQSFKDSKPLKKVKYTKTALANGTVKFTITLEPGTFGLSIMDDENNNSKMDYNMIGMPKEGFGFSDYYHTSMTRPTFSDFKFDLKGDKNVIMKMRYL